MYNAQINGAVGELRFAKVIKMFPEIKSSPLPTPAEIIEIAKSCDLGQRRLNAAYPYLLEEYGHQYRSLNGTVSLKLNWEDLPSSVLIDYIYGIDNAIQFRGWSIGIDVTTNADLALEKRRKLIQLKPLWSQLGIDRAAVVTIDLERDLNPLQLKQQLRGLIRQEEVGILNL